MVILNESWESYCHYFIVSAWFKVSFMARFIIKLDNKTAAQVRGWIDDK